MEEPDTPQKPERPRLSAIDHPEQAKAFMYHTMARNDVLGIPMAAIGMMADETKWSEDTDLYELSFATHEKWLQSDPEYAKTVLWLEKAGQKAQKQGIWMSGLSQMGDDAGVWKAMHQASLAMEKASTAPETEQKSPFALEGLSDELLLKIAAEMNAKEMRAV